MINGVLPRVNLHFESKLKRWTGAFSFGKIMATFLLS